MDLMDLAGPDWKSMSHEDLYHAIITALGGPEAVRPFLPIQDLDELERLYRADHNLNQTMLAPGGKRYLTKWDAAAGFRLKAAPVQPPVLEPDRTGLWLLLKRHGVTWMSPSQGVCLLKNAACELLRAAGRMEQRKGENGNDASRLPERFRP